MNQIVKSSGIKPCSNLKKSIETISITPQRKALIEKEKVKKRG